MQTFSGKVGEIIYTNEENGYTVLVFEAEDRYFTAVGIFPLLGEGELLKITGEFKPNKKYGEQFVVSEVNYEYPKDLQSVYLYLSSGLFKGIGPKLASQIVDYFGMKTLDVIENNPEKLIQVSGIGSKKLREIINSYNETRLMKESILFLQKFDVSMNLAMKIYRKYGDYTRSIMEKNPYILVEDIDGVGFITADKIALKMGLPTDGEFRIRAGLIHTLNDYGAKWGHTCLDEETLLKETCKILNLTEEVVRPVYDIDFQLKREKVDDVTLVATSLNYATENGIAAKLLKLNYSVDTNDFNAEQEIEIFERQTNIILDENQKNAVKSVFDNAVTVITGGPGTGKTTLIKCVVNIIKNRGKRPMLCAPTGRASKRMMQATGEEAKTIHRTLSIENSNLNACYNENAPLPVDVLIVDEISMADIYIFNALLKAIPLGARLVLVGDKDQLPSVACGNILSDVIGSGLINTVYLTDVYRQDAGSAIVSNAHRINKGLMPVVKGTKDFFLDTKNTTSGIQSAVLSMIKTRIPKFLDVSQDDIQVLTPIKKTEVGVEVLNGLLQTELNSGSEGFTYKDTIFKKGDRVMQIVNNYRTEWTEKYSGNKGEGVFNGDIGRVVGIEKERIIVEYDDGKLVIYDKENLDELTLAYCISVHKSQGSEFPVVILVLSRPIPMLLTRNLIYTAVTRAKKMVVIIGEESTLQYAINNTYTAKRYSLLKHFLLKNKTKIDVLWGRVDF